MSLPRGTDRTGKWYRRHLDAWLREKDGMTDTEFERRLNAGLELPPSRRAVPISERPKPVYPPEPIDESKVRYWYGNDPGAPNSRHTRL